MNLEIANRTAGWLAVLLLAHCPGGMAAPLVETQRLPDGAIHPQAAVDSRGRVHMIYVRGEPGHGDVYYARSDDDGRTFSAPIRVNSQPQSVIVAGTVRGPQIAIGKDDRVHVSWMGSGLAEPKAPDGQTPMLYTRMNEMRSGFEPQRNVIQMRPGLDGGGSVAADLDGNVYVAWHAPKDEKGEIHRHVWLARSRDEGRTFAPERVANPQPTGACGCCGMRIFADAHGRVYILYRAATELVNRDSHLLVSYDFGETFETVMVHPWTIGACMMSSYAFAERDEELLAAWETQQQIYFTRFDPATGNVHTASAPRRGNNRKHPVMAVNSQGDLILVWTEGTRSSGEVHWQVYDRDGSPLEEGFGRAAGLPIWGVAAVVAGKDGRFRIIY